MGKQSRKARNESRKKPINPKSVDFGLKKTNKLELDRIGKVTEVKRD